MRRTKKTDNWQPIDFRYDEGIRGRIDSNLSPTLTTHTGNSSVPFIGGGVIYVRKSSIIRRNQKINRRR